MTSNKATRMPIDVQRSCMRAIRPRCGKSPKINESQTDFRSQRTQQSGHACGAWAAHAIHCGAPYRFTPLRAALAVGLAPLTAAFEYGR
jgi:hypothetical protein